MNYRKMLMTGLATGMLGMATFGVAGLAYAQTPGNNQTSLVQAIAQKFHLDQGQVQAVFDQHKQDHKQNMEQHYQDMLTQAVKDGKLTEAQKQAIITEHTALQSKYNPEAMKDKTPEERKQAFDAMQAEVKAWAQQNGIDAKYLMPHFGMGMRMHGMMHGRFDGPQPSTPPQI